jgi:pyridoxal phosphate enzyme (YggS family)
MDTVSVATRLGEVEERVAAAARRTGRRPDEIELVAVGKGHPARVLREAFDAGQSTFGESRAQELMSKFGDLPAGVDWHFIGPLQTNKVRIVRPRVALIHSFDRDRLVKPWTKGVSHTPPALLQVNIGMEPQKQGIPPDLVNETFDRWAAAGIRLHGIMAIPPMGGTSEAARPYFARMREIRDRLSARAGRPLVLSMGMTDDFEVAIEEGSTMIRVGRAIFGD